MMFPLEILSTGLDLVRPLSRVVGRVEAATGTTTEPTPPAVEGDSFDSLLRQVLTLSPGNNVSEEALFSGLLQERIQNLKGDEGLKKFQTLLGEEQARFTNADGFIAHENAAREALKRFVKGGDLTEAEGDTIHSEAFAAAQLDDNHQALFDDRGGHNDPTMAIASVDNALVLSKQRLEAYKKGVETAPVNLLMASYDPYAGIADDVRARMNIGASSAHGPHSAGSNVRTHRVDGSQGFLYKPVSDSDGKLVVLLPTMMNGDVERVVLKNRRGKEIEQGVYRGIGNGDRQHYRFSRTGEDYPRNISVEVEMRNGKTKTYQIKNPGDRYD